MLNMGLQICVLESPVDDWGHHCTVGTENQIFDTCSARLIRCEHYRKPLEAMLRDRHFGCLGPHFLGRPGTCTPKGSKHKKEIELCSLREFVDYRHPDPRRGEPRVCSTQLDALPDECSRSAGSAGSGAELSS